MPVDEFYKPGERYPTLSERREIRSAAQAAGAGAAASAADETAPPPPPTGEMVRLV